jgi:hypothetical protein
VRRRRPTVGDVELVIVPRLLAREGPAPGGTADVPAEQEADPIADLFGNMPPLRAKPTMRTTRAAQEPAPPKQPSAVNLAWRFLDELTVGVKGWPSPVKGGARVRQYPADPDRGRPTVELYCVLPPAQAGAIVAIRTGPAEWSRRYMIALRRLGRRCVDGRVVDEGGNDLATPTEEAFFAACGLAWVPPERRT